MHIPSLDPHQGELLCPQCGGANLHQTDIRVFDRGEDAETVRVTEITHEGVKVFNSPSEVSGNPSGRRHGLTIRFYCELCPSTPNLAIYQHKGTTYMEWRPG